MDSHAFALFHQDVVPLHTDSYDVVLMPRNSKVVMHFHADSHEFVLFHLDSSDFEVNQKKWCGFVLIGMDLHACILYHNDSYDDIRIQKNNDNHNDKNNDKSNDDNVKNVIDEY